MSQEKKVDDGYGPLIPLPYKDPSAAFIQLCQTLESFHPRRERIVRPPPPGVDWVFDITKPGGFEVVNVKDHPSDE